MPDPKLNYVLARPWNDGKPQLCTYTFCNNEVFFGPKADAIEAAERLSIQEGKLYRAYPVSDTPLEND